MQRLVCLMLILSGVIFAQAEEPERISWNQILSQEVADEFYPELFFRHQAWHSDPEKWLASKEYEDLEDDSFDALEDALRKSIGRVIKQSDTFRSLSDGADQADERLKFRAYYSQFGQEATGKLTVDAGYQVPLTDGQEPKHDRFEAGLRYRSKPGLYLRLYNNPLRGGQGYHDVGWYPISHDIEYKTVVHSGKFKWGLKYDYDDRQLTLKAQDFPLGRVARCKVSSSYNFDDDKLQCWIFVYGRF